MVDVLNANAIMQSSRLSGYRNVIHMQEKKGFRVGWVVVAQRSNMSSFPLSSVGVACRSGEPQASSCGKSLQLQWSSFAARL